MTLRTHLLAPCAILAGALALAPSARAVIVLGGRDAGGALNNSGTNANPAPFNLAAYEGQFGGFLATPISSEYFVTAAHIGDQGTLTYSNGTSTATQYAGATLVGTDNDLAIWKLPASDPAFTSWAPVYTGTVSAGQDLVVTGRGTLRGDAITGGWDLGGSNPAPYSWGTGTVADNTSVVGLGNLVQFAFAKQTDAAGNLLNPDQAIVSSGDSGGATFVLDPADGQYKLLGVNYAVDAPRQSPTSANLAAVLYDARGYSIGGGPIVTGPSAVPLTSYVTDLSTRVAVINQLTGLNLGAASVPEPRGLALAAVGGLGLFGIARLRKARPRAALDR